MAAQRGGGTEQISRNYLALQRMLWSHFSSEEPWVLEWIRILSDTCGRENFCIRKEKVADSKISGYVWTGPKMYVFGFEASYTSLNNWKIRLFPKHGQSEIRVSNEASSASLCSAFRVSMFRVSTFLQCFSHDQLVNGFDCWQFVVNASRISQSYFCVVRPTHISLALVVRAVSLFLLGLPPSFLVSRGFAARRSQWRGGTEEKKRDCSRSKLYEQFAIFQATTWKTSLQKSCLYLGRNGKLDTKWRSRKQNSRTLLVAYPQRWLFTY